MSLLVVVSLVGVDPSTNSPVVILEEVGGERTLPIWIGLMEARAIASELEGVKFQRPMTHDLLKTIMELTDIRVNRVEICDLKDNTYYALINVSYREREFSIDARPSDALALSLRIKAPIFVAEKVMERFIQGNLKVETETKRQQQRNWQEILDKLDTKDLKKT
jgi:bifunctional DNase/RNase